MDPFTIFAAANAVPQLINMFSPQPGMPNQDPANQMFAKMSPYIDQSLQSAFSPQSNILQHSLRLAGDNLTSNFANRGIGQSSFLDGALIGQNADITRNWQQNEIQRQQEALRGGYGAGGMMENINADAWNRYNQSLNNRNGMINNFGSLAGSLGQNYLNSQMSQGMNDMFAKYNSPAPASPYGGSTQSGYGLGVDTRMGGPY